MCVWVGCDGEREMLNGTQPTHTRASDAGGLHLSITKGVWAPVSTLSHLLLTLRSPLLPPFRPGSPLQPLSCDWRRGESRYLVPGRRRAKGVIRVPQIRAALPPLTAVWNSIQAENQRGRWGKGAFDTAVMDTATQWHLFFLPFKYCWRQSH